MDYLNDQLKKKIIGQALRSPRVFLLLDYDGTLTPIVSDPRLAKLAQSVRVLLVKIQKQKNISVGIISGRRIREMKTLLRMKNLIYAGNMGLELEGPGFKYAHAKARESVRIIQDVKKILENLQSGFPGVTIEDKRLTLSFHYRMLPAERLGALSKKLNQALAPWVKEKKILLHAAKKVWEIRPCLNWTKGSAVRWILLHEDPAAFPIFIGDDQPDEPAFKAVQGRGISIRVGYHPSSQARYYLKNVQDVERFLSFFLSV